MMKFPRPSPSIFATASDQNWRCRRPGNEVPVKQQASFPGSWGKKSLVHTVCACSVPAGILQVWKIADTTL